MDSLFLGNAPAGTIRVTSGTRHHLVPNYDGTTVRVFVYGNLSPAREHEIVLSGNFCIDSAAHGSKHIYETINHFRIYKGVALWTENFTPPNRKRLSLIEVIDMKIFI